MSRWFRHYAGMMRDGKLVSVALKAGQPIERVLWIWGAILESAAEINDDGKFTLDTAEAAYFLRADQADLDCILGMLEHHGHIASQCVVHWGKRQFSSDRSAERTRDYRARRKVSHENLGTAVTSNTSDGQVTSQPRGCDSPETETETETEIERKKDIAADAAPSLGRYAFEEGVIRLTPKDFAKWKQAFERLDLAAELIALAPWAGEQRNWFNAVSAALAKKNREALARIDAVRAGPPKPKGYIEGII